MSIYEIDKAMLECIDEETGEIKIDEFENLQMLRDEKIENIALWIKNLNSDVSELKAEKKAIEARCREKENKLESLKKYLEYALDGQPFETSKCAVRFKKSNRVKVDDIWSVPAEYLKFGEPTVDKMAVKEAIKSGNHVEGCELVESVSMTVK